MSNPEMSNIVPYSCFDCRSTYKRPFEKNVFHRKCSTYSANVMTLMKYLVLVFISCFLIGCSPSQNVDVDKITSISVSFPQDPRSDGLPIGVGIQFNESSEEVAKVKNWLENNRDGWVDDDWLNDYERPFMRVFGYGLMLHVRESQVAFEHRTMGGSIVYYYKPIEPNEFSYLFKPQLVDDEEAEKYRCRLSKNFKNCEL